MLILLFIITSRVLLCVYGQEFAQFPQPQGIFMNTGPNIQGRFQPSTQEIFTQDPFQRSLISLLEVLKSLRLQKVKRIRPGPKSTSLRKWETNSQNVPSQDPHPHPVNPPPTVIRQGTSQQTFSETNRRGNGSENPHSITHRFGDSPQILPYTRDPNSGSHQNLSIIVNQRQNDLTKVANNGEGTEAGRTIIETIETAPNEFEEDENAKFLRCCKERKVDAKCEPRCNFDKISKKTLMGMFLGSDPCPQHFGRDLMICAAQQSDHTPCCRLRGVARTTAGDKCLGFCRMTPENDFQADISMLPCWAVLNDIKDCFKEGFKTKRSS